MKKEKATSSDNKKSGEPVKLLVLHGPNLNLLGTREPNYYGLATLSDSNLALARRAAAVGAELESFQSNHEGALIERVHPESPSGSSSQSLDRSQGVTIDRTIFVEARIKNEFSLFDAHQFGWRLRPAPQ